MRKILSPVVFFHSLNAVTQTMGGVTVVRGCLDQQFVKKFSNIVNDKGSAEVVP